MNLAKTDSKPRGTDLVADLREHLHAAHAELQKKIDGAAFDYHPLPLLGALLATIAGNFFEQDREFINHLNDAMSSLEESEGTADDTFTREEIHRESQYLLAGYETWSEGRTEHAIRFCTALITALDEKA